MLLELWLQILPLLKISAGPKRQECHLKNISNPNYFSSRSYSGHLRKNNSSAHQSSKYPSVGHILVKKNDFYTKKFYRSFTCRIETGAHMIRTRMSDKARFTRNKLTTVWRLGHVATDKITWDKNKNIIIIVLLSRN